MRAAEIHAYGPARDVFFINEHAPKPALHETDVLIAVRAASVNPLDIVQRSGRAGDLWRTGERAFPRVLGRDCSGVVEAIGARVSRFREGDEVWAVVDPARNGSYAEYVAVNEDHVGEKPTVLGHIEAASFPYAAVMVWAALVGKLGLDAQRCNGQRIVVHDGASGVGALAIQLLKAWGAHVATTVTTNDVAFVEGLGADEVVDTLRSNFARELRGFDAVFDATGATAEADSLSTIKARGGLGFVVIGGSLVEDVAEHGKALGGLMALSRVAAGKLKRGLGRRQRYSWVLPRPDGRSLGKIMRLVEDGQLRPTVSRVFDLSEVVRAHEMFEEGPVRGKIVLGVRSP